jgi:glutamate-1-semialdehyde 2,1-aminomutase
MSLLHIMPKTQPGGWLEGRISMNEIKISENIFNKALQYIPGGVNSPVRAFKGVGGSPLFIKYGKGSKIVDVDGNEFVDYVGSWGPLILGHAHPQVIKAIQKAAEKGTNYGAPTESEVVLAKLICEAMPSIEMVRMVNSGTEATMSAIRLARAFTGRNKIVKFTGCYHGHSDGLLIKAGSGVATLGIPDSPGVPASYASQTLTSPYNDIQSIEQIFARRGNEIAAVIVEPVAANMGLVLPEPGFLESLRKLTVESGALLIFDEVITGFRVAYGGAQSQYKIKPDLTCLGKIIGGGLPVGAYGGRRDIMQLIAPSGPVYQAGTLSGNPIVMAAGIETLKILKNPAIYRQIENRCAVLIKGINDAIRNHHSLASVSTIGSLFTLFFMDKKINNYAAAAKSDTTLYAKFFHRMLEQGIYLPPSQFETAFVSAAHTDEDIRLTIQAVEESLTL